jgi:hypothetical protein
MGESSVNEILLKALIASAVYIILSIIMFYLFDRKKLNKQNVKKCFMSGSILGIGTIIKFMIFTALAMSL